MKKLLIALAITSPLALQATIEGKNLDAAQLKKIKRCKTQKKKKITKKRHKPRKPRIIKVNPPVKIGNSVFLEGEYFCHAFGGLRWVNINTKKKTYEFKCIDGQRGK